MEDSATLMREFVRTRSSAAFSALVLRYLPVVYGAALRRGGSASLAEDVTQLVFADFARRMPKLRADDRIGAWLHRASILRTGDLLKSERRRVEREHQAAAMMELDRLSTSDAHRALLPEVDEALTGLRTTDREAIILRYYEGHTLRAVGTALGVSEQAAQKRIERALDKLRTKLRATGLVAGLATLTTFMGEQASAASVPSGLAGKVVASTLSNLPATTAVAAGLSLGTLLRFAMIGAIATLVIGSIPVLRKWKNVDRLRSVATLSSSSFKSGARESSQARKKISARALGGALTLPEIIGHLEDLLSEPASTLNRAKAEILLGKISDAEAAEALRLMEENWSRETIQTMDRVLTKARIKLAGQWAGLAPAEALDWVLLQFQPGSVVFERRFYWRGALSFPLEKWAKRDWEAAWAWVQAGTEDGRLLYGDQIIDLPKMIFSSLQDDLTERLGVRDTIDLLIDLRERAGPGLDGSGLSGYVHAVQNSADAHYFMEAIERMNSPSNRRWARNSMISEWGRFDWNGALDWIKSRPSGIERAVIGWRLAFPTDSEHNLNWRSHADWLYEQTPLGPEASHVGYEVLDGLRHNALRVIMGQWLSADPVATADWILERKFQTEGEANRVLDQVAAAATAGTDLAPEWVSSTLRLMEFWRENRPEAYARSMTAQAKHKEGSPAREAIGAYLERLP